MRVIKYSDGCVKVIVAGSRSIKDQLLINRKLDVLKNVFHKLNVSLVIISGTAGGVDTLGEVYAKNNNLEVLKYPADWDRYGKSAGYKRNKVMLEVCDTAFIFWDGVSKGSKHMIDLMEATDKPYIVLDADGDIVSRGE